MSRRAQQTIREHASVACACAFALAWLAVRAAAAVPEQAPAQPAAAPAQTGAEALLAAGRFDEAETQLAALTTREPSNGVAWLQLGLAQHAQTEYANAIRAFDRAQQLLPPSAGLENNRGVALFELHDLPRARAAFERAVALDASAPRAHLFLARIADFGGDTAEAEREFVAATRPDAKPAEPLAFFQYGLHLSREQRLEDARLAFERALQLDPDLGAAHLNLALVLRRLGKPDEAQLHAARFRELTEPVIEGTRLRMRVADWVRAANLDIEAGRLDSALGLLVRARKEAPDIAPIHQLLARVYALQGRSEDSRRAAELAQKLNESAQRR